MNTTGIERRERTHTLTVEVPIYLGPDMPDFDFDPVSGTLQVVMSVVRLATNGVVCDDVMVHFTEAAKPTVGDQLV